MKRKLAIGLLSVVTLLVGITIYYLIVIINARQKTSELVNTILQSDQMKLELADLTDQQLDALLKVQDPNFYHHKGYDFETPGTGKTSLSQGLVKLYYFDNFKAGIAKIKQTLIARYAFDALTPKDTILKLFVNNAYMGQGDSSSIYGFEPAAQYYFEKSFVELNWDEYLSLIAMIRAPNAFHYLNKPDANRLRVTRIKKMLSGEYIPQDNSDQFYDRE
ncbi:MAG: transglycosylase domain-containing protein [Cyclobacteriaceae bacterium]